MAGKSLIVGHVVHHHANGDGFREWDRLGGIADEIVGCPAPHRWRLEGMSYRRHRGSFSRWAGGQIRIFAMIGPGLEHGCFRKLCGALVIEEMLEERKFNFLLVEVRCLGLEGDAQAIPAAGADQPP